VKFFILFIVLVFTLACNEATIPVSPVIDFSNPVTHVPYIQSVFPHPETICRNEEAVITVVAYDAARDILSYEWQTYSGKLKNVGGNTVGYMPVDVGKDPIMVTVLDRAGNVSEPKSCWIEVLNCYAPNPKKAIFKDGQWSVK
jgi:hypothetical protein